VLEVEEEVEIEEEDEEEEEVDEEKVAHNVSPSPAYIPSIAMPAHPWSAAPFPSFYPMPCSKQLPARPPPVIINNPMPWGMQIETQSRRLYGATM
jgi:hypothetical protein